MKPMILILSMGLMFANTTRAAIVTRTISYEQGGVTFKGFLAYDDSQPARRAGVLVVPEWWGLNDFVKDKARALAQLGYVAFAADMYGDGKVTTDPDQAGKWAAAARKDMRPRAQAALAALAGQEQVDPRRLAAIGFCFGGTTVLELAYSGADLKAVVSFHGGLTAPGPDDTSRIKPEILILHGAADPTISREQIEKTQAGLTKAGVNWTMIYYSSAKHAFTNPAADKVGMPAIGYNARAAKDSWSQMKAFFGDLLK